MYKARVVPRTFDNTVLVVIVSIEEYPIAENLIKEFFILVHTQSIAFLSK